MVHAYCIMPLVVPEIAGRIQAGQVGPFRWVLVETTAEQHYRHQAYRMQGFPSLQV